MKNNVHIIELKQSQPHEYEENFLTQSVSDELGDAIQELIINLRNNKPLRKETNKRLT